MKPRTLHTAKRPPRRQAGGSPATWKRPSGRPSPRLPVVDRQGPLHAEIVVVGRELLRGLVDDAVCRRIAGELTRRGALVHRVTIVDDLERSIAAAVTEALGRGVQLVVTTGGLGPAEDDRTVAGVSQALGLPLTMSPPARDLVDSAYRRLKEAGVVSSAGMSAAREKMCFLPIGGEALPNAKGVAPGVLLRLTGGGAVVCLPGRPDESMPVVDEALARLKDIIPMRASAVRDLEAPTSDESALRPLLDRVASEHPGVWVKSHPASGRRKDPTRITLQSFAATQREADALVDGALRRLLALAGNR